MKIESLENRESGTLERHRTIDRTRVFANRERDRERETHVAPLRLRRAELSCERVREFAAETQHQ